MQAVHAESAEQVLLAQAAVLTPDQLRVTARRLTDHWTPTAPCVTNATGAMRLALQRADD